MRRAAGWLVPRLNALSVAIGIALVTVAAYQVHVTLGIAMMGAAFIAAGMDLRRLR